MSYIHTHLPVNAIVTLPHPRSGDRQGRETFLAPSADNQTRSYETEYSKHHPSLSTLRSKGLSHSKMKWWDSYMHTNLPVNASKITSKLPVNYIYKYIYINIYIYIYIYISNNNRKTGGRVYENEYFSIHKTTFNMFSSVYYNHNINHLYIYISIYLYTYIYLFIYIYLLWKE